MDRIRNKYNPEESSLKAEKVLDGMTQKEHAAWLNHPCTKSLRYTIEASLDGLVLQWVKADFTKNTIESTALINAQATGASAGFENVLVNMDLMLEITQRENYEEIISGASGQPGNN